jgi:hypothetical protein
LSTREFDDGSIADVPWASVFDAETNLRAFGAIQARGFRAATELVNRFVKGPDKNGKTEPRQSTPQVKQNGRNIGGATGLDVDWLMSSWESVVSRLFQTPRGPLGPLGPATLDLAKTDADGLVLLEAGGGACASTEVWLHNGGPADLGLVSVRCSDLLAHDGRVIDSGAIRFDPERVLLPARCSRGIRIEMDLPDDLAPGSFRGMLLADGHPDVWLPVLLKVLKVEAA